MTLFKQTLNLIKTMSSPTFEVIDVTPSMAKDLLRKNTSNRPLKRSRIYQLADAIDRGEWKLTPQGISLSSVGILLDGQHRLAAIVKTNKTAPLVIATNVDPSVFSILDTSLKRNAGDTLFLGAVCKEKIAGLQTTMAAGIKTYTFYERYPNIGWCGGFRTPSNESILNIFRKNEEKWTYITRTCKKFWSKFRPIPLSPCVSVWMIGLDNNWSMDDMETFFTSITTGAGLSMDSPILAYRNYLTNLYSNKVRLKGHQQQISIYSLIRLFNDEKKNIKKKVYHSPRKLTPMIRMVDKIDMGLAPDVLRIVRG